MDPAGKSAYSRLVQKPPAGAIYIPLRGWYITVHCNARKRRITKEATLKYYGKVWFDEVSISNIFYFRRIREKYPINYYTEGNYFSIMKPYKEVLLRQIPSGIYFHNTSDQYMVLIDTVLERREGFFQQQYGGAKQARHALAMVGYPS